MAKKIKYPDAPKVVKFKKEAKKEVQAKEVQSHPQVAMEALKEVEQIKKEVISTGPLHKKETEDERMTRVISATVKAVVSEMIPAMMAMQNQSSVGTRPGGKVRKMIKCGTCLQQGYAAENGGKPPCLDQHTKMVVYPVKYPEFGKHFQGSIINGIRYLSDNRRNSIEVPSACVGQIKKTINDYEENERQTMMGGRSADHNSGDVNSATSAQKAWR